MDLRPESRDIKRRHNGWFGVGEDHATKIIVLLLFYKRVPAGDFLQESVNGYIVVFGYILQGVKFLDGPDFHAPLKHMGDDLFGHSIGITHDNDRMTDQDDGIGAFLAVSRFLEKSFTRSWD